MGGALSTQKARGAAGRAKHGPPFGAMPGGYGGFGTGSKLMQKCFT